MACLSVLVFILFYQVSNTGSAAEWIAFVAIVSMAVTAVLAFKVAGSWLPQLTTQEVYKLAIELVNDHYIGLSMQNSIMPDVTLPACSLHPASGRKSKSYRVDRGFSR